jgi:hypothetical protein
MSGYGIKQEGITKMLGLRSPKTLRKHFREELDRGAVEAHAQVAQTCYQMANSGKHPQITMFWLRTQGRWREGTAAEPGTEAKAPFIVALERGRNEIDAARTTMDHLSLPKTLPGAGGGSTLRENATGAGRTVSGGLGGGPPGVVRGADLQTGQAGGLELDATLLR